MDTLNAADYGFGCTARPNATGGSDLGITLLIRTIKEKPHQEKSQ